MAGLSATETAFAGFGLVGRKPLALVGWGLAYLAFTAVVGVAIVTVFASAFAQMQTMSEQIEAAGRTGGPDDAMRVLAVLGEVAPFYAVLMVGSLVFYGVVNTSIYRALLRPEEGAPFHIGLGSAELRQMLLSVVMSVFLFVFYVALVLCVALFSVVIGLAATALKAPEYVPAIIIALFACVVVVGGLALFLVRFSLVGPATFAENGLRIFRSWRLTQGNFWTLLGAYFLIGVLLLGVYALALLAVIFVTLGAHGFSLEGLRALVARDPTSLATFFTPSQVAMTIGASFLGAFVLALVAAPAAYAYKELAAAP